MTGRAARRQPVLRGELVFHSACSGCFLSLSLCQYKSVPMKDHRVAEEMSVRLQETSPAVTPRAQCRPAPPLGPDSLGRGAGEMGVGFSVSPRLGTRPTRELSLSHLPLQRPCERSGLVPGRVCNETSTKLCRARNSQRWRRPR